MLAAKPFNATVPITLVDEPPITDELLSEKLVKVAASTTSVACWVVDPDKLAEIPTEVFEVTP